MRVTISLEQALLAVMIIGGGVLAGLLGFVVFVHWFGLTWVGNL